MVLDTIALSIASFVALAFALWWFLRHNDELPLAIAAFNFLFVRRLWVIEGGLGDWVQFDYGLGFDFSSFPHLAATYMLLGAVVLICAYCLFRKTRITPDRDTESTLKAYLARQRPKILAGFILFTIINAILRLWIDDSTDLLYSSSYTYQFTLAHSSFIILIAILVGHAERGTLGQKAALFGVVAITGLLTVTPTLRFALIGWVVVLAIVFTGKLRPRVKLAAFLLGGVFLALVFTIAGIMRNPEIREMDDAQVFEEGTDALFAGSDVNMVDGFTMLLQVYPDILDYGLGREHLEILTRPIPREIWPDKPVGGWNQKLAVARGIDYYGTGISPSLYGSFYGEGGAIGVVVLSAIYGWLFARYVNWADRYRSALRWILRGALIASLFALIRGGDIPGIFAFLGMSYWPLAIFVWGYVRGLRKQARRSAVPALGPGQGSASLP